MNLGGRDYKLMKILKSLYDEYNALIETVLTMRTHMLLKRIFG